jgi:hypothetical protein
MQSEPMRRWPARRHGFAAGRVVPLLGPLGFGAGITGLALARAVAGRLHQPTSARSELWIGGLVLASTIGLAVGVALVVASAGSSLRSVFRSRRLWRVGVLLVSGGLAVAAMILVRHPFPELFAHGAVTAVEIADAGAVAGGIALLAGGAVALVEAGRARDAERHWYRRYRSGPPAP